jgi:hypothetical protein
VAHEAYFPQFDSAWPPLTHPSASSQSRVASSIQSSARSLVRSVLSTGKWLRRALWVWPIVAAVVLGTIGVLLRAAVERNLRQELAATLQTILNADVAALELWWRNEEDAARAVATNSAIAAEVERLVAKASPPEATQLDVLQLEELKRLRDELRPICEAGGYAGWIVVNPQGKIVASMRNELIGINLSKEDQHYAERALRGTPTVTPPRKSLVLLPAADGTLKAGVPTMFALAPIRGHQGEVVAVLGLRIPPQEEFTRILQIGRPGKTGETYAVARDGRLVSASRFDDELRQLGLLTEDQDSILNISIRDPGVDLTQGQRARASRSEQPLTRAAASVVGGQSDVDVAGYRDYRGVKRVGAWRWLDEYELGVITEQDAAEAFEVLSILRLVFWSMFALLSASAVAIFAGMVVLQRKNREAQRAALELRQLGQYTLEEKLGEGGMGVVYRGRHAMLHRPTAIKFLDVDKTNDETIARFEREVQLTARLTHPNTIAVYDYGRTPEGIFYYAMECLEGINLEELVRKFGPLPEGRAIHILQQVCGSLAEAHAVGLIHRDIKPANVFLTCRGGLCDFVKLLDFGLVRAVDGTRSAKLTSAGAMAGTPYYLSPEAIERPDTVDARSDLYSVGAVGYFLLTGTCVFDGRNILEIVRKHVATPPEPPSQRLGKPLSVELEELLLKCLQKAPEQRPASAEALADALAACVPSSPWTKHDAVRWWSAHFPSLRPGASSSGPATASFDKTVVGGVAS